MKMLMRKVGLIHEKGEDCFEFIGKPRSLCDEYVEQKFISPFNEKATVVTKEWVTNQYNTYIAVK